MIFWQREGQKLELEGSPGCCFFFRFWSVDRWFFFITLSTRYLEIIECFASSVVICCYSEIMGCFHFFFLVFLLLVLVCNRFAASPCTQTHQTRRDTHRLSYISMSYPFRATHTHSLLTFMRVVYPWSVSMPPCMSSPSSPYTTYSSCIPFSCQPIPPNLTHLMHMNTTFHYTPHMTFTRTLYLHQTHFFFFPSPIPTSVTLFLVTMALAVAAVRRRLL